MPESLGHGKWSVPDIPHRGWRCIDFEDLEGPAETCEMCEAAEIRYVHIMQHRDYPNTLRCGCVCAGHMEQDYAAAAERERKAQNRTARRVNWLRRAWRLSYKGNYFLNTEGFNITVYWKAGSWHARVLHRETGREFWSKRRYRTEEECKLAALDGLIFIKEHVDELL